MLISLGYVEMCWDFQCWGWRLLASKQVGTRRPLCVPPPDPSSEPADSWRQFAESSSHHGGGGGCNRLGSSEQPCLSKVEERAFESGVSGTAPRRGNVCFDVYYRHATIVSRASEDGARLRIGRLAAYVRTVSYHLRNRWQWWIFRVVSTLESEGNIDCFRQIFATGGAGHDRVRSFLLCMLCESV